MKNIRTITVVVFVLIISNMFTGCASNPGEDRIEFLKSEPEMPATLSLERKFVVMTKYKIETARKFAVFVQPIAGVGGCNINGGSEVYSRGEGIAKNWFYFEDEVHVTRIKIIVEKMDFISLLSYRFFDRDTLIKEIEVPVDVTWKKE